jgi:hypothetical protein
LEMAIQEGETVLEVIKRKRDILSLFFS